MKATLIGEKLSHSYSKEIHEYMGLSYSLSEVKRDDLNIFLHDSDFDGFNVTIPYKTDVIEHLDEISPEAKDIGAVNTILKKNGKLIGYNTDVYGLDIALKRIKADLRYKNVMILGTGGASKTAFYLSKKNQANKIYVVSRTGEINYTNVYEHKDVDILINTTPNGMYPHTEDKVLLDIKKFSSLSHVFDLIYNPLNTKILLDAKEQNIACDNGLYMLVGQAIKAEELWGYDFSNGNKTKSISECVDKTYNYILNKKQNIILEGMPGCGKSTIGKELSKELNKTFVDIDAEIEKTICLDIPSFFKKFGEEKFREVETEVIKNVSKQNSLVIALGGGSPIKEENRMLLKQNGKVIFIERPLEELSSDGRPISKALGVEALYKTRNVIYEDFKDFSVSNSGTVKNVVNKILSCLCLS